MTDRVQKLTIILEKEYRTDDIEAIVNSIKMTRGVASVHLGEPSNPKELINGQNYGYEVGAFKKLAELANQLMPGR